MQEVWVVLEVSHDNTNFQTEYSDIDNVVYSEKSDAMQRVKELYQERMDYDEEVSNYPVDINEEDVYGYKDYYIAKKLEII